MINISKESKEFIEQYVLCDMGYKYIDENNISEIVDYIIEHFEVPLAQAQEAGEAIDEHLLELATNVVTEITSHSEW